MNSSFQVTPQPRSARRFALGCGVLGALTSAGLLAACGPRHDDSLNIRVGHAASDAATEPSGAWDGLDAASDAAITTRIAGSLATDAALKAAQIEVSTLDGLVTLTGSAPSAHAISRATALAVSVRGVRTVTNRVVVRDV